MIKLSAQGSEFQSPLLQIHIQMGTEAVHNRPDSGQTWFNPGGQFFKTLKAILSAKGNNFVIFRSNE